MWSKRRPALPIKFRPTAVTEMAESRFPAAVAGEDYGRYERAMWRQAERWFSRSAHRIARQSIGVHDAREILLAVAERDLARRLYPQEDRLLSELVQEEWSTLERWPDDAEPEIPGFLLSTGSGG